MEEKKRSVIPGAEPIRLMTGSAKGVLLIHSFFGTPHDFTFLAQKISEAGISVYAPLLPAHGTTLEEMSRSDLAAWFSTARDSLMELKSQCSEVYVAGLSMGALFTVLLAAEFDLAGIVLLSMPWKIPGAGKYLLPLLRPFTRVLYNSEAKASSLDRGLNDPEARASHIGYTAGLPVAQLWQLHKTAVRARKALPRVRCRALAIQSREDRAVPLGSLDLIMQRIGSAEKDSLRLTRSGHTVTLDYEKDIVAERIIAFIRR